MTDFKTFLLDYKDKRFEKRGLLFFLPPEKIGLFEALNREAPVWRLPLLDWKSKTLLPIPEALAQANLRLQNTIPSGYSTLVTALGPCLWAGLYIGHPDYLYPVDCEPPELNGFVTLANVDGDDTFLAYNPAEATVDGLERKIYFCNYEEYAVTTASFEDCIRSITALWLKNPGKDAVGEFCEQLEFVPYSKK